MGRRLFNFIQISLFLLISGYLTAKLTFGEKGVAEYYKIEKELGANKVTINFLEKENKKLSTKLSLLNESSVNSLYLEEMARTSLNFGIENEKLIILEDE